MFCKGDNVVYGSSGICTVIDVCPSPFGKGDLRDYYALRPHSDNEAVIYTPAKGGRVPLRAISSREEVERFIDGINKLPNIVVPGEKRRRDAYKEVMSKASLEGYARIIKTVAQRRKVAKDARRQLALTDTEYERSAKSCLYNEISMVLDIPFDKVECYIKQNSCGAKAGQN
ncbi:MAG: CarD family transcriptional regulator [Eubacteriales bacterium]